MPIIQTFNGIKSLTRPTSSSLGYASSGLGLYNAHRAYADIYRTQTNVRTCVDFLARNIAQLGLHTFRRVSDTDRVRLIDHDLPRWIGNPNPTTRRYRLIESLVADLAIYFNAYWLKARYVDGANRPGIGLIRLPPPSMRVVGGLLPTHYRYEADGIARDFALSEVVYFNGYNPLNPLMGLSPLETLRNILAEEAAANEHREAYWRNAGRMEGIIEQGADAPKWTDDQKKAFREQWQEFSAGGAKVGMTAILPKGMTLKPWSFSAKDSEYTVGGKLRREVCAAAFHIPQPMVGILDHATFSNIKEQHKHLYQDTLGPWLEMIQQEIEAQLLIESDDREGVYTEFNILDKLKGSFEEQATSIQVLVGRPVMTANEGRARLNLPKMTNDPTADQLAEQQGGPAAFVDTRPAFRRTDDDEDDEARAIAPLIAAARTRQQARLLKFPAEARPAAFAADLERWNLELASDVAPVVAAVVAKFVNATTLAALTAAAKETP